MCFERFFNVRRICRVLETGAEKGRLVRGLGVIGLVAAAAGMVTAMLLMLMPAVAPAIRLVIGSLCFGGAYLGLLLSFGVLTRGERVTLSHYGHVTLQAVRQRVAPKGI
jgi:hypothetical protein